MVRLKVWGRSLGNDRLIVAATSQKEAAAAMGMSLYLFREYACETGNDEELEIAMREPGVLFSKPNGRQAEVFERVERRRP